MSEKYIIIKINTDSIAEDLKLEAGDSLIEINGKPIKDIFDYRYLINDEYIEILIEKSNGEEWLLEIEKDESEDLGIEFEQGLMDDAKSCKNKCIFCFIDQLPPNMRETLYFKDDDTRLSFLQGNYVTLTNMKEEDIDRIIYYHLSPINISVHSTDIELRTFMLKNPNSANLNGYIERLKNAGISMNFQIVLCKNINDGINLDKTIKDLSRFIPNAKSLSVVPVGITKYRQCNNLFEMLPFEKKDATEIINQIHNWQEKIKKQFGTSFVFAADEFYLKAEIKIPSYDAYEDFPQIENGVGMISLMRKEFYEEIKALHNIVLNKTVSIATGKAAYSFISEITEVLMKKVKNLIIKVYCIENIFFGEHITVSGLLTGQDIIEQLNKEFLGDILFVPDNALRSGESVFLDDLCIKDIEKSLSVKVIPITSNARDFISTIIN